ncbi:MAG TPA: Uma2 family endonuclease [Frankiaceae bacterium]|nr:Uma2 family endonuclease [Frankiaceae bacterium]
MTAVTALPLRGGPFTRADLESMPDDGRRYELIDGCLLVTPAPRWMHQRGVAELFVILRAATPDYAETLPGPFAIVPEDDTELQPDVFVARRADFTEKELPAAPLLVVEVLSPSTRSFDLGAKRERYERAGTPAYWVFDPAAVRLRAWELRDGAYVLVGDVSGDEAFETNVPFPVRVVPSTLV